MRGGKPKAFTITCMPMRLVSFISARDGSHREQVDKEAERHCWPTNVMRGRSEVAFLLVIALSGVIRLFVFDSAIAKVTSRGRRTHQPRGPLAESQRDLFREPYQIGAELNRLGGRKPGRFPRVGADSRVRVSLNAEFGISVAHDRRSGVVPGNAS